MRRPLQNLDHGAQMFIHAAEKWEEERGRSRREGERVRAKGGEIEEGGGEGGREEGGGGGGGGGGEREGPDEPQPRSRVERGCNRCRASLLDPFPQAGWK